MTADNSKVNPVYFLAFMCVIFLIVPGLDEDYEPLLVWGWVGGYVFGAFCGWHTCKRHHDVEQTTAERGRLSEEVLTLERDVERLEEELNERDRQGEDA